MYTVPFGDYQREIALTVPPELRVIMYRRLMFKVAEALAARERAGALVTGESLGQVASQTLDNIRATDDAVDLPVFRPLIGTDKLEIIREAERLGSYEISSQDAPAMMRWGMRFSAARCSCPAVPRPTRSSR